MSDTPTRIGPYAIERRLGAGGMAETFVALRRMQTIEQRVCLKRILPAYARDATARRLFHREANISARLRHANLVQVLDVGEDHGTPYLVMELVEGVDLDHVLDGAPGRRLPPALVGYVLAEIAHGLHEAHGGDGAHDGVVHRDLSPSNVLLSVSGEVKVADFGIAKALTGDKATATMMRGKFAYMAPEQLDGAPLDPRADMFALGVMGFEMLAGVRPFDADGDARLVLLIAKNERKSIAELVPDAPRELLETIEALLSPQKESRPATGHDVVERLAPMLPAAVVARRQLGKLVSTAYEAKLAALAREPSHGGLAGDAALAATVMANAAAADASPTPSTRPGASAVSTPIAATVSAEPTTERNEAPVPERAGARSSPSLWAIGAAVVAIVAIALVGSAYLASAGSTPDTAASVTTPSGAPPGSGALGTAAPPTSIVLGAARPPATGPRATTASVGSPPVTAAAPVRPTTTTTPPPTTAHALPPTSAATRDVPPTTPPTTTTAAEDDGASAAGDRGHLHIVASPWGQIWIDGRFMGRAPIDASLRPGSHRIGAGFEQPTVTRSIRVRAGMDERVELEVGEP